MTSSRSSRSRAHARRRPTAHVHMSVAVRSAAEELQDEVLPQSLLRVRGQQARVVDGDEPFRRLVRNEARERAGRRGLEDELARLVVTDLETYAGALVHAEERLVVDLDQ